MAQRTRLWRHYLPLLGTRAWACMHSKTQEGKEAEHSDGTDEGLLENPTDEDSGIHLSGLHSE